jgi:hypothetical protein
VGTRRSAAVNSGLGGREAAFEPWSCGDPYFLHSPIGGSPDAGAVVAPDHLVEFPCNGTYKGTATMRMILIATDGSAESREDAPAEAS